MDAPDVGQPTLRGLGRQRGVPDRAGDHVQKNSVLPVTRGRIGRAPEGRHLTATIGLHWFVAAHTTLWLGLLAFIAAPLGGSGGGGAWLVLPPAILAQGSRCW